MTPTKFWPLYLSSNNSGLTRLHCETCGCSSHDTSASSFCPSKIFLIEFASDVIDQQIPFYDTIALLGFNYHLKSLVRCKHNHFTCATRDDNIGWLFIDDLSNYVSVFQSASEIFHIYSDGCFFAVYTLIENSSIPKHISQHQHNSWF